MDPDGKGEINKSSWFGLASTPVLSKLFPFMIKTNKYAMEVAGKSEL